MSENGARFLVVGQVVVLALLVALLVQTSETRERVDEATKQADAAAAAATKKAEVAAAAAEALSTEVAALNARVRALAGSDAAKIVAEELAAVRASVQALTEDLDILATGVGAVERNLAKLTEEVLWKQSGFVTGEDGEGMDGAAPPGQPVLEFTPELRETLRAAIAPKGVVLTEDRVSIPGEVILRQGNLEYFAVFVGGKAHESIFILTGIPEEGEQGARGLGAALNSSLMALGMKPGTPLRVLPGGKVLTATGTTVHIAVEWEEDGALVRVRAEDLLWDSERNRSLDTGKFIYVGSYFEPEGYVPDLAHDAVAVYSVPTAVIDLDDKRAATDTIFLACGPRIPAEGTKIRMVFSPLPLEPTRTWDPEKPAVRTDPGAPPPLPDEDDGVAGDGR
jgi:hypothetical protein